MTLLLTLSCGSLYAQKQGQLLIDSLLKELAQQKDDTNKVKVLDALSDGYSSINHDKGTKYAQQELELATKLEWKTGIADAYYCIGLNYHDKSDFSQKIEYYSKSLKIFEETGNKMSISAVANDIGVIYYRRGDYPKTLEYWFKALKIDEEIGNKNIVASVIGNIGNVYNAQGDYPKALEYYFKALKIDEEIGNKIVIANAIANIGTVYQYQRDYPKALEYDSRSLKMYEEIGDKGGIANITSNIGIVYVAQGHYTDGIAYYFKALKINEGVGNKNNEVEILKNIGAGYIHIVTDTFKTNKPENMSEMPNPGSTIPAGKNALLHKSVRYLLEAIVIDKEIGSLDNLQQSYAYLSRADSLLGDYRGALEAFIQYTIFKDSVFSQKKTIEISRLEMVKKIETDSLTSVHARQVIELKLRQQRNYTYLGIAGILLLTGFSFFIAKERGKSEKERKKSDQLLLNILPEEVANELKINGTTTAKHYDNVTVLFSDFVNFTSAGERMKPQALIDELHTCFKKFDEITGKYNIEKIKTIGDAYLAVAGLPAADSKHAENTVRAAVEINAFMQDRIAKLGNSTFDIRIGIHSGSVVAGIVGVKKFAYDIWGDAVNTAARMEQNSEPGKINISQNTYELVKGKFSFEYRGEIDTKGKGMLKMYFVE